MLPALFDHLWQSTLFAALAGLLTLTLRNNRARVRHAVWLAASCKFFIPISLLISFGSQFASRTPQAPSSISVAIDTVSEPFTGPVFGPSATAPQSSANPLPQVLFGIWLCGFVGIAATWLIRWRRIRTTVRRAPSANLDLPIEAKYSPALIEPGVFGIFRPTLLLSEGIENRLTPAQLNAVIAHELCHIRHRDNLTAAIQMFIETVFWFHPLVWWIGRQMLAEREQACDEEVLQLGSNPRVYAEGILNICKLYTESPLTCVSGVTGSDLKKRIQAILTRRIAGDLSFVKKAVLAVAATVALIVPVVIGMIHAPTIHAQSPVVDRPEFEAASIRLNKSLEQGSSINPSSGRFSATNVPTQLLIQAAYSVRGFQISGGPGWINSINYDVSAKAPGNADEIRMLPMLRSLLEDRFKLRLHRETKDLPVYVLSVARNSSGIQSSTCTPRDQDRPRQATPGQPDVRTCGTRYGVHGSNRTIDAVGMGMGPLTATLSQMFGRAVVNKTGLDGRYDFHLEWLPDTVHNTDPGDIGKLSPAVDQGGMSIFTALKEELGLKLESGSGPVEVLVIDHIERPSEN